MKKAALVSVLGLSLVFTLAGCQSAKHANVASADKKISGKVVAVGSTALQPLVEQAGQTFQDDHSGVTINVQGGGSGAGLGQVSKGAVNIGNSDLFAEEQKGLNTAGMVDHRVAVVGMAPVVNPDTNVKNVTKQQLKDIFTGKIDNWKAVGGKDEKIVIINRAKGSGTRATFEKFGLDGQQAAQSQEQDSNGTVQKIVKTTPGAISYLAFSYIKPDMQALSIDHVKPTDANVADNHWKIWSYEHMYTKGKGSLATKTFIKFMTSDGIQKHLVKKLGYIPLTSMHVSRDVNGNMHKGA
ncbi:phosphate ABC transporter substrate-binding protein PstS family protein [Furfurilactobacillus milii]|uniref:Phosphate-binding protein n=1 Tax=Furfurilactobacillus milii TaxID=2888272 RepID=A0ABT6DB34_9LACO|nr:phosphate ABC transporter substrate-binding protein PstS family protein [Furfurilactobacillus milii]QLE67124.1 Phosphate ABC transporter periplasmic phosphate-binding protein PstS [Furfurilactobacillus rossiae]MCF6161479.1 phosphate ABC transporter substrate-binding protein PstS family protein [Furfurilactobacillus milii]MCF6163858.1 phosphate ABC transporter substrate-binding protein PstS family protein [Furfurilactobacillus milii]MCF6418866.1 phosphate ABC transporter substrate-binding pro